MPLAERAFPCELCFDARCFSLRSPSAAVLSFSPRVRRQLVAARTFTTWSSGWMVPRIVGLPHRVWNLFSGTLARPSIRLLKAARSLVSK